jgi:hypothetical protein
MEETKTVPTNKTRSIYIDDADWEAIQNAAIKERESASQYMVKAAFARMANKE